MRLVVKGLNEAERYFGRLAKNAPEAPRKASKIVGYHYKRKLERAVQRGTLLPPGARQLTVVMKRYNRARGGGRGTRTPYGLLSRAIRYWVDLRGKLTIGLLDEGPQKVSRSWLAIGRLMSEGRTMKVTRYKRYGFFKKYGLPRRRGEQSYMLRPTTQELNHPARPFIEPFMRKHQNAMIRMYREAFFAKAQGKRYNP